MTSTATTEIHNRYVPEYHRERFDLLTLVDLFKIILEPPERDAPSVETIGPFGCLTRACRRLKPESLYWKPGETLKGYVFLQTTQPIILHELYVTVGGRCRVEWRHGDLWQANKDVFTQTIKLQDSGHRPVAHCIQRNCQLSFQVTLPRHLPPSLIEVYGDYSYYIFAHLKGSDIRGSHCCVLTTTDVHFKIAPLLDVRCFPPQLLEPKVFVKSWCFPLCPYFPQTIHSREMIAAKVTLTKQVFLAGGKIVVDVTVDNFLNYNVICKLRLKKVVMFHASHGTAGDGHQCTNCMPGQTRLTSSTMGTHSNIRIRGSATETFSRMFDIPLSTVPSTLNKRTPGQQQNQNRNSEMPLQIKYVIVLNISTLPSSWKEFKGELPINVFIANTETQEVPSNRNATEVRVRDSLTIDQRDQEMMMVNGRIPMDHRDRDVAVSERVVLVNQGERDDPSTDRGAGNQADRDETAPKYHQDAPPSYEECCPEQVQKVCTTQL